MVGRMVVDKLASSEQCKLLMELAAVSGYVVYVDFSWISSCPLSLVRREMAMRESLLTLVMRRFRGCRY